jgi:hypothetical protein
VPSNADEREPFDPVPILAELAQAGVDFVVIGGVAGGAHGSSYGTFDLDIAYAREGENLERLAEVLRGLGAELRGALPRRPFQLDAETLHQGANFTFSTRLGAVDIPGDPAGAPPYERLREDALAIDVRGYPVRIASLDHLIAMKEAAGRPRDKLMASEYRVLSDESRAPREP